MSKCPRFGFLGLGGVCHKRAKVLRITHGSVTETTDAYSLPLGPYSTVHWKCNECGATWVERKQGKWLESDFS